MSDLNSCSFTGCLGKDATVSTVGDKGTLLTSFSMANNTGFGNNSKTNWIDVQLWGNRGNALAPYLLKGTRVAVAGCFEANNWVDQNGSKHTQWRLTAHDIVLLPSGTKKPEAETPQEYSDIF